LIIEATRHLFLPYEDALLLQDGTLFLALHEDVVVEDIDFVASIFAGRVLRAALSRESECTRDSNTIKTLVEQVCTSFAVTFVVST
jgi:hypothetical protein